MQAVVLAGGEGIKLRPLTFSLPKPLLPLINKPLIDYIVYILKSGGIKEIILTTDYKSQELESYIHNNQFEIPIKTKRIDKFEGTAQILRNIKNELQSEFLVVSGDCIFDIALDKVINEWRYFNADMGLIVRKEKDLLGRGGLILENHRITDTVKVKGKFEENIFADTWIYYLKKTVLDLIPESGYFDIHLDLISKVIEEKLNNVPIIAPNFWAMIGRVHPYIAANFWLLQNIGTNTYVGANAKIHSSVRLIPPYFIDENCEISENVELGPNVIIGKNSKIYEGVSLDNAVLHSEIKIGQNCNLKNCVISHNCQLGNNVKIEELAIVASGCVIKNGAILEAGSRVGPNVTIEENQKVADFIFPFDFDPEAVKQRWEESLKERLNEDEMSICLKLQECGEQTCSGLASRIGLSGYKTRLLLESLTARGIIISDGKKPIMYSLFKEF